MNLKIEENLNLEKNNINNEKNFLKTAIGIAINEAINCGIRKVMPNFIENQIIEIKDVLFSEGLKEGINKILDNALDVGKSISGIFTGDFKKMSDIEMTIKNGGIIKEVSKLFDKTLNEFKEKKVLEEDVFKILYNSKDIIEKNLINNLKETLYMQKSMLNKLDNCLERCKNYQNKSDFDEINKEYSHIKERTNQFLPVQEIADKLKQLDNIYSLIKNNTDNTNLSKYHIELAKIL